MKRMTVPEEGIETLFGSYDENLKHLEALFNVRIRTHGHDLLVEGDSLNIEKVDRVVGQTYRVAHVLSGGHTARTRMPMRMSAIGMPSMRITMIVVSAPSSRIVPCT